MMFRKYSVVQKSVNLVCEQYLQNGVLITHTVD